MRRRTKIILVRVIGFLVLGLVALRVAANGIILSALATAMRDTYRLDVETKDLSFSLFSGEAKLAGLRILDAGDPVFEAEEIEVAASIRDLVGGRYEFRTLVITRPMLHMVVEKVDGTNIARILGRPKESFLKDEPPPSAGPAPFVFFHDARIIDGKFLFEDSVTDKDHKGKLDFEEIDLTLTELQVAGEHEAKGIGDMRLDAFLMQKDDAARISLVGWAPSLTAPLTIDAHLAITGLDLRQFPQYVDKKARSAIGGDVIHLGGTLLTKDDVITRGALAATIAKSDTELSLRFGGSLSHIVFDKDSQLSALFALPLGRIGHMGDVAMTSTWNAVSGVGKGVVGAGESVAEGVGGTLKGVVTLDPLGALEAAGGGLVGGAEKLGKGFAGLFGFGGDDKDAERDKNEQRRFTEIHKKCQRAMLKAALESAKDSSGARKERIEAELARVSPEAEPAAHGEKP